MTVVTLPVVALTGLRDAALIIFPTGKVLAHGCAGIFFARHMVGDGQTGGVHHPAEGHLGVALGKGFESRIRPLEEGLQLLLGQARVVGVQKGVDAVVFRQQAQGFL